jgi:PAS domain S-box-containing protein
MIQNAEKIQKIKELLKNNPRGMSVTDLVEELNVNKNSIGRYLDTLLASGQVEMRRYGMAKVYTISNRLPLNAMLSISSDLILVLDSNLGIVNVNDSLVFALNVSPPDILGKNILYSPIVPFFGRNFDLILNHIVLGLSGTSWEGEVHLGINEDQDIFHCRIVPMVFESGQIGVSITLCDIGDQKFCEKQLRFQADLLKDVTEAVIATDREGTITYWNDSAENLFLYSSHEAFGKNFFSLILSDTKSQNNILPPQLREGKRWSGDHLAVRKNRTRFPISLSMAPRFDVSGSVIGYVGTAADISAEKRAEKKLKESELRYRTLFDNALDGIILLDIHATVLMINFSAARMFDIDDPGLAIGKDALDFITPESRMAASRYIACIKDGRWTKTNEQFPLSEFECRTSAGRKFWIESMGTGIIYDDTPMLLFSMRDITNRKQAERAIREGEEKYRMLFDNTSDMISLYEFDKSGMPGLFLEINDIGCRMLGYSREELLTRTPLDIYPPECIPLVKETIEVYHSRHHVTFERIYVTKDGRRIPIEVSAHHFTRNGKEVVLSISRDITSLKNLEKNVQLARSMMDDALNIMPAAFWSVEATTGKCIFVGPNMEAITAQLDSFFMNSPFPWSEMVHPDDRPMYLKQFRNLKRTKFFELRYRICTPDGGFRWVQDRVQLVVDKANKISRINGITFSYPGANEATDVLKKK